MLEKIKYFLPPKYRNDALTQSIVGAFYDLIDELKNRMQHEFEQFSASTSDLSGISEWEKELAITPKIANELELRRAVVRSKLMRPPTVTPERFIAVVNCFTVGRDAEIKKISTPFTIGITFHSGVIGGQDGCIELIEAINITKPAHLAIDISFEQKVTMPIYTGISLVQSGTKKIKTALPEKCVVSHRAGGAVVLSGQQQIKTRLPVRHSIGMSVGGMITMSGRMTIGVREGEM